MLTKVYDRILQMHPITGDYAAFTDDQFEAMKKDISVHGLRVPIVVWNDQVVDGRHRYRACRELGITPEYNDVNHLSEKMMRDYVASLNQHRRARTKPLSNDEKRKLVEAELKKDAERTDREIERITGVDHVTVGRIRKRLDKQGVVKFTTPSERKSVNGKVGEGQRNVTMESIAFDTPMSAAQTKVEIELNNRQSPFIAAKIRTIKDELSADHKRSNAEIAKLTNTGRVLVGKVRAAEGYPTFSDKVKPAEHKSVPVPNGKLLSDVYREVIALENDGLAQEEAAKRVGVGVENYRIGRNIIRLAENERLDAKDRQAANSALELMNRCRRPSEAYEGVRDIADRLWGTKGGLRTSKQARKLLDRYIQSTLVIAELAEQIKSTDVPYLNKSELATARSNLNRAASRVRDAIKNIEESCDV